MTLSESHELKGKLTILMMDRSDRVVEEVRATNDITLEGRKLVAQLFGKKNIKPVDSILIGTGTKDFDANDNKLEKPIEDFSIKLENIEENIKETKDGKIELTLVGTLNEKEDKVDGKAITEACLYSSESKVMYNRVNFDSITKSANFKLKMIWSIIF